MTILGTEINLNMYILLWIQNFGKREKLGTGLHFSFFPNEKYNPVPVFSIAGLMAFSVELTNHYTEKVIMGDDETVMAKYETIIKGKFEEVVN